MIMGLGRTALAMISVLLMASAILIGHSFINNQGEGHLRINNQGGI